MSEEEYEEKLIAQEEYIKILEDKINAGASAGSVDIFFKIAKEGDREDDKSLFCCEKDNKGRDRERDNTYILIQNKYYTKESSDIAKYDASKIYSRASKILDKVDNFKIVLMVNSGKILNDKLKDFDKEGLDILGVNDIEEWFQKLLHDLYSNNISKFIDEEKINSFKQLEPRFHQRLFIDSTLEHIKAPQNKRKFIWGAVPRSGKSYMIGGLISQRAKQGIDNDIVIIMGAKSETEGQFKELFDFDGVGSKKYIDFKEFGFSTPDDVNK